MSSDELVIPGDRICVIEEFVPGANTYADIDGSVRACVVGKVVRNVRSHDIYVEPLKAANILRQGLIVYGQVVSILNEKVAVVKLLGVWREDKREIMPLKHAFTGLLHVSQASETYCPTLRDIVGVGDVVKARIISRSGPPYLLSIRGPNLGVVYALCPVCRVETRKRGSKLQCPVCGMVLKRKTPVVD